MINVPFEQIKALAKVQDLFEPVRQAFIDYNSPRLIGIPVNLLHFANEADAHIKIAAIEGYEYFSINRKSIHEMLFLTVMVFSCEFVRLLLKEIIENFDHLLN